MNNTEIREELKEILKKIDIIEKENEEVLESISKLHKETKCPSQYTKKQISFYGRQVDWTTQGLRNILGTIVKLKRINYENIIKELEKSKEITTEKERNAKLENKAKELISKYPELSEILKALTDDTGRCVEEKGKNGYEEYCIANKMGTEIGKPFEDLENEFYDFLQCLLSRGLIRFKSGFIGEGFYKVDGRW